MKTKVSAQAKKMFVSFALATLVATPVWAATKTVTLSVANMTCAACPITVKKALSKVEGVSKIDVSAKTHEAIITFDDSKASLQQLTEATGNAGYPSTVKE